MITLKELLEDVEPVKYSEVRDVPRKDEAEAGTIYILRQEWALINGDWTRLR